MDLARSRQINSSIELTVAKKKFGKEILILLILLIILLIAFITSLMLGRYNIPLKDVLSLLREKLLGVKTSGIPQASRTVLYQVRLPRIAAAILIGGSLAASGASYQGMFKNPMVSPDILGASAGAGFGAALGILFSFGIGGIQFMSFGFGMVAVFITYIISSAISRNNNATLVLVLSGMVVSTLFSSFVSMIKYVADPYSKLPAITFWLMGSLSSINPDDLKVVIIPVLLGLVPLLLIRWKLNVLSFGEEESRALGINTSRIRLLVIVCSTLMTASAVSISGLIGWIGLIIPHLARMLVGPNYKILLPASVLIGASYLLFVDDIARLVYTTEIPLGILTSLIGAPFFIWLLLRSRRAWV